jgi:hypothetical protein
LLSDHVGNILFDEQNGDAMKEGPEHGRIEHRVDEGESLIWDATVTSTAVKEAFAEARAHRKEANKGILARLRPKRRQQEQGTVSPEDMLHGDALSA